MSFPLYGIIAIAAGGGALLLGAAITIAIVVHRRREHRQRSALDNLRQTLQTGPNVDMHQMDAYSPKKKRTIIWASDSSPRNKLQRSPQNIRTLRQASSRDSIKPLIKHKKSCDGPWKPTISIVDTSNLEVIEPAPVYMPTGRPGKMLLTPISEKDTPESNQKTYRGVPHTINGLAWTAGSQGRPLPLPKNHQRRSLSDSVSVPNTLKQPMPKSILKKPSVFRSVSLQNQFPGPVPEQELPPTPKMSHSALPQQAGLAQSPPSDYPYYNVPISHVPSGTNMAAFTDPELLYRNDHQYKMPIAQAPFLHGLGRKRTPPGHEQYELRQLRTMDNSPAHSTKSSIRPPIETHNSYEARVERFSLVRDKSSNLSLSLQDNWVTPSKPSGSDRQGHIDERWHDADQDHQQEASPLMLFDRSRRQVLQESNGNSGRPSLSSRNSHDSRTGRDKRAGGAQQTDRRPGAPAPRTHSHKPSATHRIVIEPSRPNSIATSAVIPEDSEFDLTLQQLQQHKDSSVSFMPIDTNFPPGTRPPSAAIFDPAIECVPALYGLQQRELENDPDFQNPNPDYSPLMSICNMTDGDYYSYSCTDLDGDGNGDVDVDCSIEPLTVEPRNKKHKHDTLILPPPTRNSPLSSSPPEKESPFKINPDAFPRPGTSHSTPTTTTTTTIGASNSNSTTALPNTSSLRKNPGRRCNPHRSPLRQSMRPSDDSPDTGTSAPRTRSRESLLKQQARIATTIMALRRQNSDVSQVNAPYFRLSGQGRGGLGGSESRSSAGMEMLNKEFRHGQMHGTGIGNGNGNGNVNMNDPFTDTSTRPAYLPGLEPKEVLEDEERRKAKAKAKPKVDVEMKLPRPRTESERGLSPTAKKIMAEERREQYERRKSSGRLSPFGAIGEERKARNGRGVEEREGQERGPRAKRVRKGLERGNTVRLSPGTMLTMAGAF